ncbi:FecR family protein [Sphingomonas montanisoli]|uniref:DUF4880 domain-containing protein n=1 Tax=Sphingomonas montanisoli TaxID=2606412 RepID=A0A5D9CH35_9SPHN|nr:FecR domain-containing protein [Sphingomonas montanisoli]TZG29421.1 DUF4880 domain-containing protein [Sphingomonas montanisoli]
MTTEDEALDWVIRLRDPGFEDWEAFGAWMAGDPARAEAYHALAIAEEDLGEMLPAETAPVVVPSIADAARLRHGRRTTRRLWLGGALAASVAALVGSNMLDHRGGDISVATAPGERRSVALADGSRMILNGNTVVRLDSADPRMATLDRGEVLFEIRHDEKNPFRVSVGGDQLLDVGTAFNVVHEHGVTAVQVSEGAVMYNPDSDAVRLDAGKSLRVAGDQAVVGSVVPGDVAAWRDGRLISDGQTMAEVAAHLSRYTGERVSATAEVANRPFRGVLSLGTREDIAALGPILGVAVHRTPKGWELAAR